MQPRLYTDLTAWYRLIDPPQDHQDEAASYQRALERMANPPVETLLELGAGAGHNAFHLKQRFRCTLTDPSPAMQALSRALNPTCEHAPGDMRTLRLGRVFDAVLVHDAVMYMLTEADLAAAMATAFMHMRPGGAAVFAPDGVRDDFVEHHNLLEHDEGTRSVRGLEWSWDPDPSDDTCRVDYTFMLRDGADVEVVHDVHIEGMFTRATWHRLLTEAGFEVATFTRPLDEAGAFDEVFVCRRPL
ncbi:MAG TPA: class I SAM-dependent methyltransferase [Polyangia bacterium]